MATAKLGISGRTWLMLATLFVLTANYASVKILSYPFVYCWLSPLVIPIYDPVAGLLHIFAMLWFGWSLLRGSAFGALRAGVVLVVIFGLPQWSAILFRMEGSCG